MRAAAEKWAPWLAGLVLLAGIASFAAVRLAGGTSSPAPAATEQAVDTTPAPLDPQARTVAREFVATAVARKRLGEAWQLAAPSLRGHLTLAEWRTGNIPVQPYPVAQATARWAVEQSTAESTVFRVTFLPRKASVAKPGDFHLALERLGGRWRVSSFTAANAISPTS